MSVGFSIILVLLEDITFASKRRKLSSTRIDVAAWHLWGWRPSKWLQLIKAHCSSCLIHRSPVLILRFKNWWMFDLSRILRHLCFAFYNVTALAGDRGKILIIIAASLLLLTWFHSEFRVSLPCLLLAALLADEVLLNLRLSLPYNRIMPLSNVHFTTEVVVRSMYCGDSLIIIMVGHWLLEAARNLRSQLNDVCILVLDLLPELLPLILHILGLVAQLKHLISHLFKLVLKVVILFLQLRVQKRYRIVLEEICDRETLITPYLVSLGLLRVELGWYMRDWTRILAQYHCRGKSTPTDTILLSAIVVGECWISKMLPLLELDIFSFNMLTLKFKSLVIIQ